MFKLTDRISPHRSRASRSRNSRALFHGGSLSRVHSHGRSRTVLAAALAAVFALVACALIQPASTTTDASSATQTSDTYTVTVRFVDDRGTAVADEWSGTYASSNGTSSTGELKVPLPEVTGYKVSHATVIYGEGAEQEYETFSASSGNNSNATASDTSATGSTTDAAPTTFRIPNTLTCDTIFTIRYTPRDDIPYKIELQFQALNENLQTDEIYAGNWVADSTLTRTLTLAGTTGDTITSDTVNRAIQATLDDGDATNDIDLTGFTMQAYDFSKTPIAADGSTIIHLKYNRSHYKITLELNGGTGFSDLYVQYGAKVSVADPTKTGYAFGGWYADAALTTPADLPASMPATNETYYAKWTPATATFTVAVWIESAETTGQYTFLTSFVDLDAVATESQVSIDTTAVADRLAALATQDATKDLAYYHISDKNYTVTQLADTNNAEGEVSATDTARTSTKIANSITVAGDGSSTLNVYYDRNSYTLRFYYARQDSSGTWYMSQDNNSYSKSPNHTLSNGCRWTTVKTEPQISAEEQAKINASNGALKTGTQTIGSDTFCYIDLTAKYGANISTLWPMAGCVTANLSNGTEIKLLTWGTQYNSGYWVQNHETSNYNPNIKPYHETMDEAIITVDGKATTADAGYTHGLVCYTFTKQIYTWTYNFYLEDAQGNYLTAEDGTRIPNETLTVLSTDAESSGHPAPVKHGYEITSATYSSGYVANFTYKRNTFTITINNCYQQAYTVLNVRWGTTLAGVVEDAVATDAAGNPVTVDLAALTPATPNSVDNWEALYKFSGKWYSTNESAGKYQTGVGVAADFASGTAVMPMNNLVLYAGWTPRIYTARFHYATNPANSSGTTAGKGDIYAVQTFVAGDVLDTPDDPTRAGLNFEYWGYYKDANGKALAASVVLGGEGDAPTFALDYSNIATLGTMARVSFTTTTFLSDVDIFAVWNSNVPVKYKVNYVLQETNADGTTTETKIADTLYGEGISGQEVTVSAKIGDELYQGYRGFYDDNFACYAKVATHTITLDATVASAEETGMIEYIFCYIKSTGVTYAVNYWLEQQDETGQPILDATGNPVYALYTKNAEGEWVCSTTTTSASANANANANAGEEADTDSTETDAATSSDSTTAPHSITVKTSQAVITTSAPNFDGYSFIGELPTGSNDILSAPGAFNANGTYLVTRILSAAQTDEITEANTINFYYNYIRPATYELPSTGGQDAKIYILAGLICALLAITLVRHARFSC